MKTLKWEVYTRPVAGRSNLVIRGIRAICPHCRKAIGSKKLTPNERQKEHRKRKIKLGACVYGGCHKSVRGTKKGCATTIQD